MGSILVHYQNISQLMNNKYIAMANMYNMKWYKTYESNPNSYH